MHLSKIFQIIANIFIFAFLLSTLNAKLTIIDSKGKKTLAKIPERVVVLNWDLLESIVELNITPVGAPNLKAYNQWVRTPSLPQGIVDIGTRFEPNIEKIAQLKPDVIIVAGPQKELIAKLEKIAPVLYFSNHEINDDAYSIAIKHFQTLGVLFGKQELANQKIKELESELDSLKNKILQKFQGKAPSVTVMRFANQSSIYLYSKNSLTSSVVARLGLKQELVQENAKWGIVQQRLTYLQNVKESYVLYFLPAPDYNEIEKTMLWQQMPFVKLNKVSAVTSVWNYGGAMSIKYIGQEITKSLLEIAQN